MKNLVNIALRRKKISAVIVALFLLTVFLVYRSLFGAGGEVRYMTARVEKGTLVVSISGSGQVAVSNQLDLKPKVSGDVLYVGVKSGQQVWQGALIAQLDSRDAQKAVRDAEVNFESAKLAYEKLKKPAEALTLLQAENSLAQAQESKQKAEDNLKKSYEEATNSVANAFLDLPDVMAGLQDLLLTRTSGTQWNIDYYADVAGTYDNKAGVFKKDAYDSYQAARKAYDQNFSDYKTSSRFSENETIEKISNQTYETTKLVAEAVKSASNLIQFYQDKLTEHDLTPSSFSNTHLSSLDSYTAKTNSHLSGLLSSKRNIQDDKEAVVNAERSIAEKTESLAKVKNGADDLDLKSQELSLKKAENSLLDAREKLNDYFIRAPFAGVMGKVDVKVGDSVSSGTAVATIVGRQQLAEISLNEVDVAKVKIGQKANMTFDAVPDLTVSGQVVEVDSVGTVSQGVVTYIAKISFDTQDDKIKPSMSVSANIITDAKADVLMIPNSALKQQGRATYAEVTQENNLSQTAGVSGAVLEKPASLQQVETGLVNDEFTEVIIGLKEGDMVITRTIDPSKQTQTTQIRQQNSAFPGFGGSRGGNATRPTGGFR